MVATSKFDANYRNIQQANLKELCLDVKESNIYENVHTYIGMQ